MANAIPIFTGEGFKREKLLTYLSFGLLALTIVSTIYSIRANSLQHKQISEQMAESKRIKELKEEEKKNNITI